jgi:hypothetical protein
LKIERWELVIPSRETLAGNSARKYARRKALGLAALVGFCVVGGLGFAFWTSQCPVDVGLERIDPTLMVDRSMIVSVAVRNPAGAEIHLNMNSVRAVAKESERWVKAENLWTGSDWLLPNCKTVLLLQVPRETVACRIRLEYSLPTFKERLIALRRVHQLPSASLTSLVDQWLWPARGPGWVPPPRRWTEASFVVSTPRELGKGE